VSKAAHALASSCLTPKSCFAVPKLRTGLLALALVDVCDCGMLVGYRHRDVSTQKSFGRVGDQDAYAVRFCAFRLRCACVKGFLIIHPLARTQLVHPLVFMMRRQTEGMETRQRNTSTSVPSHEGREMTYNCVYNKPRDPFQQVMYQECLAELMRESVENGTDDGAADRLLYLAKSAASEIVLFR
jgi:hypothetical protein